MLYLTHIPGPPLNSFVELFWFYDGFPARTHKKERLMPDGSVELVINLNENETRIYDRENLDKCERLSGGVLCGPHSRFFVIDTAEQDSVIGIHFKPGGAFPFFKLPADELQNQHVSLEDLWGPEARTVRERLLEAPTPEIKFQVSGRVPSGADRKTDGAAPGRESSAGFVPQYSYCACHGGCVRPDRYQLTSLYPAFLE